MERTRPTTGSQGRETVGPSNMEDDAKLKFRQQLLSINDNLGTGDVAALKFLCTDFLSCRKLEGVKLGIDLFDHLIDEGFLSAEEPFLLAELLYKINRPLLFKTLGYTSKKVQECLHEKGRVSPYRQMLFELAENTTNMTMKEIIFLLQDKLPKRSTAPLCEEGDKCANNGKSPLDLLTLLEKQSLLREEDLEILEKACEMVSHNLLRVINRYKKAKDNKAANVTQAIPERSLELPGAFSNVKNEPKKKIYKMDGPHRGFCLVINNVKFKSSEREGSQKDAEELERVFTWLGLDVIIYPDQTSEQIIEIMEIWQRLQDHKDRNCFICCILSHGESGAIHGTDEKPVSIRRIMSHFTAKNCPQLAGKPKLFFIQACQGVKVQRPVRVEVDAQVIDPPPMQQQSVPLSESIPEDADFLLGLATIDGCVAIRHIMQGTWYIQALCSKLRLLVPRGEDILSILEDVNEEVATRDNGEGVKQMPQPAYTLRGKVIFPVPSDPPPSEQHQGI
ncbi:caspase-8-like isoform X1 [Pithys albifrons albifrons]|uniref:caspase-8-like isoform X1 n=2 Tax=Pithys albifrons albifrons TaxID=3385563 RepID=UPI003A5CF9B7